MEKSMAYRFVLFLALFSFFISDVYSQEEETEYIYKNQDPDQKDKDPNKDLKSTIYKTFSLKLSLKPDLQDEVKTAEEAKQAYYFVGIKNAQDKLVMVSVYNRKNQISTYVLNKRLNLYFSFVKFQYRARENNISKAIFFNKDNKAVGMINYVWRVKNSKLVYRNARIMTYSLLARKMIPAEYRVFYYGNGSKANEGIATITYFDKHHKRYAVEKYINSDNVIMYKRLARGTGYEKNYTYTDGKLSRIQTYNQQGILLSDKKAKSGS